MKRNENTPPKSRKYLKRKLMSALCMLLISTILMATSSYAWLVLSTAPEVTGITTNIGANGSLEIALLNTATRGDLTTIRSGVGDSLAARRVATANNTWGNLIDLSFKDYGLDNILLLPARLDASAKADNSGYKVNSGMLAVPTYGYDGRIVKLDHEAVSAVFGGKDFSYVPGSQDYGVRAIGTISNISAQSAALGLAKSNIPGYSNSAKNEAVSSLTQNGNDLFNLMVKQMAGTASSFTNDDLAILERMLSSLAVSLDYIDLSLRQGIIAAAAAKVADETVFVTIRDRVNAAEDIETLLSEEGVSELLPADFQTWVTKYLTTKNALNSARTQCNTLKAGPSAGSYTWAEIRSVMDFVMDTTAVYINGTLFNEFDKNNAGELMGGEIELSLANGSGIYADIADFTGNYSATMNTMGTAATIITNSAVKPAYLTALSEAVELLTPADNSAVGTAASLTSTFGYVLDMAFRCNAPNPDLLLQTTPEQRVYDGSSSPSTMGGGSYMEFTTQDQAFSLAQMIDLMDAIRVGFVDGQGNLLGVAKLNTSNRSIMDGAVKAPLYLYDYGFSTEEETYGAMVMGERRKTDNKIMDLTQNTAAALSVVVWLDGDMVDNTMVSATKSASLNGTLNLQFSTSADLVPAGNSELLNMTPSKTELKELVTGAKEKYDAGQLLYTTASWKEFISAYTYADSVSKNALANEAQIYHAMQDLVLASGQLTQVSQMALSERIADIRALMGYTTDPAYYVWLDPETKLYYVTDTYTDADLSNAESTIYQVDYEQNLQDEGDGATKTPIFTDASWSALAAALYEAELLDYRNDLTDEEIRAAITALDTAEAALQRSVYYLAYEHNGRIFYFAISDETDTYGKWYDAEFKRIISDKTILELDAYAEPAVIATIQQDSYVKNTTDVITPYITLQQDLYDDLKNDTIKAVQWNPAPSLFVQGVTVTQLQQLQSLRSDVNYEQPAGYQQTLKDIDDILSNPDKYSDSEVNALMAEIRDEIADALSTRITDSQKILLGAAIASAMTVEGYGDATLTTLDTLRQAVSAASNVRYNSYSTQTEAEDALTALNAQLVLNGKEAITAENTPAYTITSEQRTVLTTAIASAKAVEDFDNEGKTDAKLVALRTAVTTAEELLKETLVTPDAADEALTELNTQLKANGQTEVTAENTIVKTVPVSKDSTDLVYEMNHPNTRLLLTGDIGNATITAVVLTENGIVYTVSQNIGVYYAAGGAEIGVEGNSKADALHIKAVATPEGEANKAVGKLVAQLINRKATAVTDNGNVTHYTDEKGKTVRNPILTTDDEGKTIGWIPNGETIKSYTWASSDTSVVTVSDSDPICTATAKGVGSATVTLSVKTYQGNTYTAQFPVSVYYGVEGVRLQVDDPVNPDSAILTADNPTRNLLINYLPSEDITVVKDPVTQQVTGYLDPLGNSVTPVQDSGSGKWYLPIDESVVSLATESELVTCEGTAITAAKVGSETVTFTATTDKGSTYTTRFPITVESIPTPPETTDHEVTP